MLAALLFRGGDVGVGLDDVLDSSYRTEYARYLIKIWRHYGNDP
jgi:hypothetical protein